MHWNKVFGGYREHEAEIEFVALELIVFLSGVYSLICPPFMHLMLHFLLSLERGALIVLFFSDEIIYTGRDIYLELGYM